MVKLEQEYYRHCGVTVNLLLAYLELVETEHYPSYGIENAVSYSVGLDLITCMAENDPAITTFTYEHALTAYAAAYISSKLLLTEYGAVVAYNELNPDKDVISEEQYSRFKKAFTTFNTKVMELIKPQVENMPQFKKLEEELAALSF